MKKTRKKKMQKSLKKAQKKDMEKKGLTLRKTPFWTFSYLEIC